LRALTWRLAMPNSQPAKTPRSGSKRCNPSIAASIVSPTMSSAAEREPVWASA
jgi:hypothetical protein